MCKSCHNAGQKAAKEERLRVMLAEAYEAGAEDGFTQHATKETRDTYVKGVIETL